jgi:hypothetical protein
VTSPHHLLPLSPAICTVVWLAALPSLIPKQRHKRHARTALHKLKHRLHQAITGHLSLYLAVSAAARAWDRLSPPRQPSPASLTSNSKLSLHFLHLHTHHCINIDHHITVTQLETTENIIVDQ